MTDSPQAATDELSAPLGKRARRPAKRWRRVTDFLPLAAMRTGAGVLGCFTAVFLGWALFAEGPLGGEPTAVASVNLHTDTARPADARGGEGDRERPNRYDGPPPTAAQPAAPTNNNTVTVIDGTSGKRQEFVVPNGQEGAVGEARFAEASRGGMIPKIAEDGTRPAEAFAQPVKAIPDRPNAPRVAIIVAGLGISAIGTGEALAKLPGPVTLAFAPYGADLDRLATRAREGGHEILLQVPMEPFDYPDNDPGPRTLLTSLGPEQNLDRLYWLMSRFQGYVGVANYMGARFTSTEAALAPVLKEASRRGLIYVDDGSSPRSLAGQIAGANNLPFARVEVALDAVPTPAHIDRALAKLETLAREHGSAVGIASALPASIERIGQWAKAAEGRGIVLVPITAVAIKPKSS